MPPFDGPMPQGVPGAPGGPAPPPLPQSLTAAPPQSGPGTPPSGNPGNTMQSLRKIDAAVKMLQEALPGLPMGSPEHEDLMKFLMTYSKHVKTFQTSPQGQKMALMQQLKGMHAQSPNAALQRLAPPGAAPAPPTPPDPPMGG